MADQPQRTPVHPLTRTAIKLSLFFDDQELAHGSCFLYRHGSAVFLITAAHNFTGKHPGTGECLSRTGGIPNRAKVAVAVAEPDEQGQLRVGWYDWTLPLYDPDRPLHDPDERPLWTAGDGTDVAALRLPSEIEPQLEWHTEVTEDLALFAQFRMFAGMDAFVLGFPEDFTGGGVLPIWKRATLATEPGVANLMKSPVLIDTATRNGMSGAPVFTRTTGLTLEESLEHERVPGRVHPESILGETYRFLGVYTSRPLADATGLGAQLGAVYTEQAILDTILSGPTT
jgi:hypothetical protein